MEKAKKKLIKNHSEEWLVIQARRLVNS